MTIPGRGDLAPRRRHYGYRRRRWPSVVGVVVLVVALGVGGWFGWQHWHDSGGKAPAAAASKTPKPCPSPTFRTTLSDHPGPVDVLNGTHRDGLAHTVAKALRGEHVPIGRVDNARHFGVETSVVTYPPADRFEAWVVASRLQPAARLDQSNGGHVQLVLGSSYHRLAAPAEQTAAINGYASHLLGCHYDGIHIAG